MPYPQHPGKHRARAVLTPARYHRYVAERTGAPVPRAPANLILAFGRSWAPFLRRRFPRADRSDAGILAVAPKVGLVVQPGPGAPAAVIVEEELIALGVRRIVVLGMAGSLQPDLDVGSIALCRRAVRDEGTSHHYAPPGRYAYPSPALTDSLRRALGRAHTPFREGTSWTIDAPYRETFVELRRYRTAGVLTVEMEAAAVFVVARRLGCEAAGLFVVSDHLRARGWEPRFGESVPTLHRAFDLVVDALQNHRR